MNSLSAVSAVTSRLPSLLQLISLRLPYLLFRPYVSLSSPPPRTSPTSFPPPYISSTYSPSHLSYLISFPTYFLPPLPFPHISYLLSLPYISSTAFLITPVLSSLSSQPFSISAPLVWYPAFACTPAIHSVGVRSNTYYSLVDPQPDSPYHLHRYSRLDSCVAANTNLLCSHPDHSSRITN